MSAGSVTVTDAGAVTKSGLAEAIFDQRILMLALVQPPGVVASGPDGAPLKKGIALDANALATAIWTYLLANGEITGTIKLWSAAAAPSGYLLCDGSAVSRTTYAALFAVCGTTFGSGDGSSTFNLPDLRGRAPIGVGTGDASDATAHTLGEKEGTERHAMIEAEMPSHTHAVTDPGHEHDPGGGSFLTSGAGSLEMLGGGGTADESATTSTETTGITLGTTGSGLAHPNMQPSLTVNFIIKV
jgi:microcystin-dependent protein